ncbi:Signal transduction histidine kinase involved in nitrogen fixation and metabolism regulation [Nitrosomonas sp. Nm51]|uniref:sensor histidine kinase n=1 Tax=Nitrosomonas sp. Nm51 TaxID=133720 RepID=UPI0008C80239|nr:ATP-binding protein [Nitrosomonas sp. Nm51]SER38798.1 Signal transduction histidine kinase involved in nitrogen fixation and metabolism regulation [Nitrosomonas sp. Nm51]
MKYVLIIGAGLGAIMLFLLATAGANTDFFERRYQLLLIINIVFVLLFIVVVGYLLWRFIRRLKSGVFGSRLALRLLSIFSLMAILPGALVYTVSVQFLEKSIESWFDVKVDRALESGLHLGQTMLENLLEELQKKAKTAALSLSDPSTSQVSALSELTLQTQIEEATLFNQEGKVIAFSSENNLTLFPEVPSGTVMRHIRTQKSYSAIEPITDKGLYLRVLAPVNVLSLDDDIRILQLLQPVPEQLAHNAEKVQEGYWDYQELSLSRHGLTRLYSVTLTLALLLSLFSALATASILSENLSSPLGMLAESTKAIAQGDYSRRHLVQSRDELGILTESFNLMTQQLEEARAIAQYNQHQVESARAHLESILSNLSSGVLVFDENLALIKANRSAEQILQAPLISLDGSVIDGCVEKEPQVSAMVAEIRTGFNSGEAGMWQRQITRTSDGNNQVLLLRGTRLPAISGGGGVVVFDDITSLLQVQRAVAWSEIARRLAHEIKNPLTPIQLSAERLEHKLAEKLNEQDALILQRSIETIVNQVEALKRMVNEFNQYARAPALEMRKLDINQLVREILSLYDSSNITRKKHAHIHIKRELADDLPAILGDSAQLRQVFHNLLLNAQDALNGTEKPVIEIETEATQDSIKLSIRDNGCGFSDEVKSRVFEPYVTTKPKGTGLGLPIVKKIVEEHSGAIHIENLKPQGAQIIITLPVSENFTSLG